ncbi:MAG: mycothiol transferase, partial [Acidimicrobiia bacterium]
EVGRPGWWSSRNDLVTIWSRGGIWSMDIAPLLLELYGRISPLAREAIDGIDLDRLTEAPAPGANTVAWLLWHLARVQDDHVAELLGSDQIWAGGDWARRFGVDPDPSNTGYGHSAEDAAAIRPESSGVLLEYLDVVWDRTRAMLENLVPADLDRIVDQRWDPPVTLGVRLVSIADDSLQHAGQAAYLRGLFGL